MTNLQTLTIYVAGKCMFCPHVWLVQWCFRAHSRCLDHVQTCTDKSLKRSRQLLSSLKIKLRASFRTPALQTRATHSGSSLQPFVAVDGLGQSPVLTSDVKPGRNQMFTIKMSLKTEKEEEKICHLQSFYVCLFSWVLTVNIKSHIYKMYYHTNI